MPIILGVNSPQYTDEELEEFRRQNAEGIDFEGKHYTLYEATQRQRSLERSIRKTKRKILIDEATGDAEKLQWDQIRLVRTREEYHRFSKATGLPEQYERMETAGFTWKHGKAAEKAALKHSESAQTYSQSYSKTSNSKQPENTQKLLTSAQNDDTINLQKSDFEKFSANIGNRAGMIADYNKELSDRFAQGSEDCQKAFTKFVPENSVLGYAYQGTPHFNPNDKKIRMNFADDLANKRGAGSTFFHEHGHYIDFMAAGKNNSDQLSTSNPVFGALLRSDFDGYVQSVESRYATDRQGAFSRIAFEIRGDKNHSISDLFGGLTDNKCVGSYQHRTAYWQNVGSLEKEAFAHMYEASFDKDKRKLMQQYFPNAYAEFEKMIKGVV